MSRAPTSCAANVAHHGGGAGEPPIPATAAVPIPAMQHDINCEFWHDHYPLECTCGLSAPRAACFVPFVDATKVEGAAE